MKNNMKKLFLTTCVTAAIVGLQACNADDPDMGSEGTKAAFGGKLIDGYLAGATIYLDLNMNNRRNAGEPYAITDKDGYFSTSKSGVDYCRDGADENETRHCLRSVPSDSKVLIRTYGGFDVTTGEPFTGSLARSVNVSANGVVQNSVVSPLTTAVAAASDDEKEAVLTDLGITEDDLDVDFLNEDTYSSSLTGKALALHKVATAYSELINEIFTEFGDDNDLPSNSYDAVYKGLVGARPSDGVWEESHLQSAFTAAIQLVSDLYVSAGHTPPAISAQQEMKVIADAKVILGVIDATFTADKTYDALNKDLLGVELVTTKIVYEKVSEDEVNTIVTELANPDSNLSKTLENANADFQGLAKTTIDDSTNYDELVVVDPQNMESPIDKQLSINYDEDGTTGAFHIFFKGNDGASSGSLVTCLTYTTTDPELDDDEFDLDQVNTTGSWFNIDQKSMVVTFTFGGGNYDVVLASKGKDSEDRQKYSFSYGGENVSWYSNNGLISNDDPNALPVPASNDDCAAVLN